jgi:ribbon-helix-helix CopG family protein
MSSSKRTTKKVKARDGHYTKRSRDGGRTIQRDGTRGRFIERDAKRLPAPSSAGGNRVTLAELRQSTREYDAEVVDPLATAKPLSAAARAKYERVVAGARKQLAAGNPIGTVLPPDVKARIDAQAAEARRVFESGKPVGRPVVGAGAERVTFSIERELLAAADAFARASGRSRSDLIAEGLRLAMKRTAARE